MPKESVSFFSYLFIVELQKFWNNNSPFPQKPTVDNITHPFSFQVVPFVIWYYGHSYSTLLEKTFVCAEIKGSFSLVYSMSIYQAFTCQALPG